SIPAVRASEFFLRRVLMAEKVEITMKELMVLARIASGDDPVELEILVDQIRLLHMASTLDVSREELMDNLVEVATRWREIAWQRGLNEGQVIDIFVEGSYDPDETRARLLLAFKLRGLKGS